MACHNFESAEYPVPELTDCEKTSSPRRLFIEAYEKYWRKLYEAAYGRLQDKEVAEEIVQDIFTELWERQDIVSIRNIEHYLMSAVKFAIIDYIRGQSTRRKFLEYHQSFLDTNSSDPPILDYHDLPRLVNEGMEQLSETTRKIFWLNHFQDWKKETIASHFQLSEKAIEYHLTKSLKTIRIYLKNISF